MGTRYSMYSDFSSMGNGYYLATVRNISDDGKSIISDLIYYPPHVEVSSPDLSVNLDIYKPKIGWWRRLLCCFYGWLPSVNLLNIYTIICFTYLLTYISLLIKLIEIIIICIIYFSYIINYISYV